MDQFMDDLKSGFRRAQIDYNPLLTTDHLGHALSQYLHHRESLV
jgi:hypothetical protein